MHAKIAKQELSWNIVWWWLAGCTEIMCGLMAAGCRSKNGCCWGRRNSSLTWQVECALGRYSRKETLCTEPCALAWVCLWLRTKGLKECGTQGGTQPYLFFVCMRLGSCWQKNRKRCIQKVLKGSCCFRGHDQWEKYQMRNLPVVLFSLKILSLSLG